MAREDRWRDDRRWDFDEEAREMRRRADYGQTDQSGDYPRNSDRRYVESGYPEYRRSYRDDMEESRRAARTERYDRERYGRDDDYRRQDDDYRRQEERAYRPFGTTGPTAYGAGSDPYLAGPAPYAPYGNGVYPGYAAGAPGVAANPGRYTPNPREGRGEEPRSFMDKARDEVTSWFGDTDAERRRRWDEMRAGHRGRGPKGYRRSDERIREDVNDRMTDDAWLDASDVEVAVKDGDVILTGYVLSREDKRRAERLAEDVGGVGDVQNNLRVRRDDGYGATATPTKPARDA